MNIPNHIGFILDGNRRWAKQNNKLIAEGHRQGYSNFKTIADTAFDIGVKYVSGYVFSTENWNRDRKEVQDIMSILRWVLSNEIKDFHKNNIKILVIGSREKISKTLVKLIEKAEDLTKNNDRGTVILCLDYGGQQEIVSAIKKIVTSHIKPEDIDINLVANNLHAPEVPPPDLIIRTSGEQRLSNFLTWQSAYSELIFSSKYWPEYSVQDLNDNIAEYNNRQRRFGK